MMQEEMLRKQSSAAAFPRIIVLATLPWICTAAALSAQTSQPTDFKKIYKTHAEFLKLAQEYPLAQRFLISSEGKPLSNEENERIQKADRLLAEAETAREEGDYAGARDKAEEAMQTCRAILGPTHYLSISATGARRLYGAYADQLPNHQAILKEADKFAAAAKRDYQRGNYPVAELAAKNAIEYRERVFGKQFNELVDADSLSLLGLIQTQRKRYKEAEESIDRSIQVIERSFGNMHPKMAVAMSRKGWLQLSSGKGDKALETLRRASSIMNNTVGETLETARIQDYLGTACTLNQDYEGAIYRKVRSLVVREKLGGADAVDTGESLSNLAWLYTYIDLPEDKMPLRKRALDIFTQRLGPTHPFALMELSNIAHLHESKGQYDEAIRIYEQYLDKRDELPILNEVQWSASLSYVYLQANRMKDAERIFKMILEEARKAHSVSERQVARDNLSAAISGMLVHNLYDEAARLLQESAKILEINERELAKPAELIGLYSATGRYKELLEIADAEIKRKKQEVEINSPAIASLHYARADAFISMGQFEQADEACQEILRIVERSEGSGSLSHAASLSLLGRIHTKQNRLQDAGFDFAEAGKILSEPVHKESAIYLNYLLYRSDLQVALKQLGAAKDAMREVVERTRKSAVDAPKVSNKTQLLVALKRYHAILKLISTADAASVESELKSLYAQLRDRGALDVEAKTWAKELGF